MEGSRVIRAALTSNGWKRIRKKALAVCLLCFAILASGLEEGDDAVNVISVENLDALLGLRMVTELNLKNLTGGEQRSRRGVRTSDDLCGKPGCDCATDKRGISCRFGAEEVLELGPGSVSPQHRRLTISNLTNLRILPGAFAVNSQLKSISLSDVSNLTVGSDVFQSESNGPINMDITNCEDVTMLDRSFIKVWNLLRLTIEDCDSVTARKSVFPARLELHVINVPNLVIDSNTFSVDRRLVGGGTSAEITFDAVTVKTIPGRSFTTNGARINFVNCDIGTIEREAFRALELQSVYFYRTSINRIETEAFSGQTGIRDVELNEVNVRYVAGQALSAASNLTIRNSRLSEISDGAFNVAAAFLRLSRNKFRKIGRHAFAIQSWNSIVVDSNEFESLKQDTFSAPFSKVDNVTNEFVFADNTVNATEVNALTFVPDDGALNVIIRNNTFLEHCHCHLESWMVTLSKEKWESFYDTSNCRISEFGSCYDLRGDYMNMKNYTATVCDLPVNEECDAIRVRAPRPSTEWNLKATERTILGVVLLGVTSSVVIMLIILGLSWMRQKSTCGEMREYRAESGSCCSAVKRLFNDSNLVTTSSISRINIHEYAEIQYRMTEHQKQTILAAGQEEVIVICEDKATQTLPEELTQELLQSLREKLDDPENYNEARNMIEHLYDLIKVEESCNNNNVSRTSLLLGDDDDDDEEEEEDEEDGSGNVYDVIPRRPRKRSKKVRKVPASNVTSTGTRAPSPDKLSPVAFNLPRATVVTDYSEPRDRTSNEYCELPEPRDPVMPDVLSVSATCHAYAVPNKRDRMDGRPLPCKPSTSGDA